MTLEHGSQREQVAGTSKASVFGAIAAVAVLASGLLVLRDTVDLRILIAIESLLVLSVFLLVTYGLFGDRIGAWRRERNKQARWRKAISNTWSEFDTIVEHFGWFIGERKQTETTLSRVYENLRVQRTSFMPMQEFPNEAILSSMHYELEKRIKNYDGAVREFKMICDSLSSVMRVYISLVNGAVNTLRWLGPRRKEEIEKMMREQGIAGIPETIPWPLSAYEIDQTTQVNYQVFSQRLNAFLEDYRRLATRIEKETGEHVLSYQSSIPARI